MHPCTPPLMYWHTMLPSSDHMRMLYSDQASFLSQLFAQHQRKLANWERFRHHKVDPPTDIGKQ